LRTPVAMTSRPEPSGLNRSTVARIGSVSTSTFDEDPTVT
jgi:hypothetical protein